MKVLFILLIIIVSCTSNKTIIYHYDNSRYDDAEIDDTKLHYFFNKNNKSIKHFSLNSVILINEVNKISVKVDSLKNKDEFDFGHYYYAFVTKKDTLYSDYDLNYWRDKDKGASYKLNDKAKEEIKKTLANAKSSSR
jgi:hypothetical protein